MLNGSVLILKALRVPKYFAQVNTDQWPHLLKIFVLTEAINLLSENYSWQFVNILTYPLESEPRVSRIFFPPLKRHACVTEIHVLSGFHSLSVL